MNKNLYLFIIIVGIVPALLVSTNTVYAQEENTTITEEPKFIVIQHAQSGSISEVNGTTNFLELNDVSDVILFSDRPDRIVKTESTQEFLDRWYDVDGDTENNSFFQIPLMPL